MEDLSWRRRKVNANLQIVTPFPPEHYERLWGWLRQFPSQNFDDAGPKSLDELTQDMAARSESGQTIYEVLQSGEPVGVIAVSKVDFIHHQAKFCGICFDKAVHGKGIAIEAVRVVLRKLFADGVQSVVAAYFSDNIAARKMFQKLGQYSAGRVGIVPIVRDAGSFRNPATRGGQPVNMTMVVIDGAAFRANDRQESDPVGVVSAANLPSVA